MSIPLAKRKEIKDALPNAQAALENAGKAIGMTLQFVDQTADLWNALGSNQNGLSSGMVNMYKRLEEVFVEFAKNPLRLEALKAALAKVNGKVTIGEADTDVYWRFGNDSFEIVYKKNNFGCWLDSFTVDELEKKLSVDWEGNAVSLPAKVSIANAEKAIAGYLAAISSAVGKPITLAPGFYPRLYTACASETNAKGAQFGKSVDAILKQAADCITAFCKNADNKEALADTWKAAKFDFDYNEGSWVYWSWKDGTLVMQVKKGNFASWLDGYNAGALEKTL